MGSRRNLLRAAALVLAVAVAVGAAATPASAQRTVPGGPRPGERCGTRPEGARALSPATGETLECRGGPAGRRWEAVGAGSQRLAPPPLPPPLPFLPAARRPDPLDPRLGDPTGLPPGVTLPPGATVLPGSPHRLASDDWWKRNRWRIEATVATGDLEAVHAHFVEACARIGWRHDTTTVERLPERPPPGRSYDRSTVMLLGECRTAAGSAEPSRRRPWYLSWGVSRRDGETAADLVVELSSRSRVGGRAG